MKKLYKLTLLIALIFSCVTQKDMQPDLIDQR